MHATDWIQFALFLGLLTLITRPLGLYLIQVLDANGRTWLDPVIKPFEKLTYRLLGVDPQRGQATTRFDPVSAPMRATTCPSAAVPSIGGAMP